MEAVTKKPETVSSSLFPRFRGEHDSHFSLRVFMMDWHSLTIPHCVENDFSRLENRVENLLQDSLPVTVDVIEATFSWPDDYEVNVPVGDGSCDFGWASPRIDLLALISSSCAVLSIMGTPPLHFVPRPPQ